MFCFFHLRTLLAPAVLAMLLVTAPTLAQEEIDFINAPQAADLDGPSVSSRREQPPQALDASGAKAIEDADFDYSFDGPSTQKYSTQKYSTQKSCGCNECGGDSCGCDDGCRRGCDLFGCLRRMMQTSADHKRARCAGCYDTCLDGGCKGGCGHGCKGGCRGGCKGGCRHGCKGGRGCGKGQRAYARGMRHDPNRTPGATQPLFQQQYTQGYANQIPAQMYVAPYPVPASVGHTYITYQAFEPSQFMYRHKRKYVRNHGPSGGSTTTRIYWW
jgi:hypothetical protein